MRFSGFMISVVKATSPPRFGALTGDVTLGFATTLSI